MPEKFTRITRLKKYEKTYELALQQFLGFEVFDLQTDINGEINYLHKIKKNI